MSLFDGFELRSITYTDTQEYQDAKARHHEGRVYWRAEVRNGEVVCYAYPVLRYTEKGAYVSHRGVEVWTPVDGKVACATQADALTRLRARTRAYARHAARNFELASARCEVLGLELPAVDIEVLDEGYRVAQRGEAVRRLGAVLRPLRAGTLALLLTLGWGCSSPAPDTCLPYASTEACGTLYQCDGGDVYATSDVTWVWPCPYNECVGLTPSAQLDLEEQCGGLAPPEAPR